METEDIKNFENELVKHWNSLEYKPSLIVFDLDHTLWPYNIKHVCPPIIKKQTTSGDIVELEDKLGVIYSHFKDVTLILKTLKEKCLSENGHLAIASHSAKNLLAKEFMDAFGWTQYFSSIQVYAKTKDNHLKEIKQELNLESLDNALFFDDKKKNFVTTVSLGVTPFHIKRQIGLDLAAMCTEAAIDESLYDKELVKVWKNLSRRPKIIVFDLDYTLWPYYIDSHVTPPIKAQGNNFSDSYGDLYKPFKDVTKILRTLKEKCLGEDGYLAIASRSTTKDLAMQAIEIYGWMPYLSSFQIFPRVKDVHMYAIKKELGGEFTDMLFFDDEERNYKPTADIGVVPILVNQVDGLNLEAMYNGLLRYERKYKNLPK